MRRRLSGLPVLLGLVGACGAADAAAMDMAKAAPFGMPMSDEQVFAHVVLDEFEGQLGSADALHWDAQGWVGTDENRLVLRSEGDEQSGTVRDGLHELLYDRPISPFFDVQAGVRSDLDSSGHRIWAALGVQGLAPYFVHLSVTAYARDSGHYALRTRASYELLFTQRLILTPSVELNAYSAADPRLGTASGLSQIEAGMRLRYEIGRQFAPYLGFDYQRRVAAAGAPGQTTSSLRVVLGVRAWL